MTTLSVDTQQILAMMNQGQWYYTLGEFPEIREELDLAVDMGLIESAPIHNRPYLKYRKPPSKSRRLAEQKVAEMFIKIGLTPPRIT